MTRIEKKEILSDEKTKKVAMQVSTVSIVVNLLLSVFKLLAGIIGNRAPWFLMPFILRLMFLVVL
mgnify:CR=1 FL=1